MLSSNERHRLLCLFKWYTRAGLLPFEVDVKEGRVGHQVPRWRRLVSSGSYALLLVHVLHMVYGLLRYCWKTEAPIYRVILLLDVASGTTMVASWYVFLVHKYPDVYARLLTNTFCTTRQGKTFSLILRDGQIKFEIYRPQEGKTCSSYIQKKVNMEIREEMFLHHDVELSAGAVRSLFSVHDRCSDGDYDPNVRL